MTNCGNCGRDHSLPGDPIGELLKNLREVPREEPTVRLADVFGPPQAGLFGDLASLFGGQERPRQAGADFWKGPDTDAKIERLRLAIQLGNGVMKNHTEGLANLKSEIGVQRGRTDDLMDRVHTIETFGTTAQSLEGVRFSHAKRMDAVQAELTEARQQLADLERQLLAQGRVLEEIQLQLSPVEGETEQNDDENLRTWRETEEAVREAIREDAAYAAGIPTTRDDIPPVE